MEKVLLAFCPLCGERYPKQTLQERSHSCLELDPGEAPSLDSAALDSNHSVR